MEVRFRSEAVSDVVLAREWYDAQRPGLGDEFVQGLEHLIELISDLPEPASPGVAERLLKTERRETSEDWTPRSPPAQREVPGGIPVRAYTESHQERAD